jgi:hypothetical protein
MYLNTSEEQRSKKGKLREMKGGRRRQMGGEEEKSVY